MLGLLITYYPTIISLSLTYYTASWCVFMAPSCPGLNRQWPGRPTGICQVLRYHSLLGLTLRKQSQQRVLLLLSQYLVVVCSVVMVKVQSMWSINHVVALQTVCQGSAHPHQECGHTQTPPSRSGRYHGRRPRGPSPYDVFDGTVSSDLFANNITCIYAQ